MYRRALLFVLSLLFSGCGDETLQADSAARTGTSEPAISATATAIAKLYRDNTEYVELEKRVPQWLQRYEVPSAAVAYINEGEVKWTLNFGQQAEGIPAQDSTLYNVASLTKPIVAETVLRMAEKGVVNLDAPMAPTFIDPDLIEDPRAKLLTPKIMLSHRSGFIKNWREDMKGGKLTIAVEPGGQASYSGENFVYLGNYLKALTSKSLDELATQYVFAPSKLQNMWFTPNKAWKGRVAVVQGRDGSTRLPDASEKPDAADNLHSTIGDYASFVLGAMQGQGLGSALLEARATIYDDQVEQACPAGVIPKEFCPEHTGFGLGWMVYDSGENRFLVHNGKDWGERTIALFEPKKGYGVVVFTSGAKGRSVISEILKVLVPDQKLNTLVAAEAKFDQ